MFIHSTHCCSISLNKKSNGLKKQKQLRVSNTYSTIEKLMSSQTYPKGYNQVSFITYYQVNKGQKNQVVKGTLRGRGDPSASKEGGTCKDDQSKYAPLTPHAPLRKYVPAGAHTHISCLLFFQALHNIVPFEPNQLKLRIVQLAQLNVSDFPPISSKNRSNCLEL